VAAHLSAAPFTVVERVVELTANMASVNSASSTPKAQKVRFKLSPSVFGCGRHAAGLIASVPNVYAPTEEPP
jgi:hypothetical protein